MVRALALIALAGLLGTCSLPPSLLEQVLLGGELRVATRHGPSTFYQGGTEPRGVEYDLAKGYADWLGVELRIHDAKQYQGLLGDVASGHAHVGAGALSVTEMLRETVDFGPSYQHVQPLIIYRRGSRKPHNANDLVGGSLEVLDGSVFVEQLKGTQAEGSLFFRVQVADSTVDSMVRRVANGENGYALVNSNEYDLLKYSIPDAKAAFGLGNEIPLAWALRKGPDSSLRDSVAEYFEQLDTTGELERILERYYVHVEPDFDYVDSRAFVKHFRSRLPRYKDFFLQAASECGLEWQLLAAMAYQESHWDPDAVSPTGVRGIMMLTTKTAIMMDVEDRTDARQSISGGARYFLRVMAKIPARIVEPDRTWLALAAYNVGFGHLEDARIITEIQGGDPDSWDEVRQRLPLLSDPDWFQRVPRGHAEGHVPVRYVHHVRRYYEVLQWMTAEEVSAANAPDTPRFSQVSIPMVAAEHSRASDPEPQNLASTDMSTAPAAR